MEKVFAHHGYPGCQTDAAKNVSQKKAPNKDPIDVKKRSISIIRNSNLIVTYSNKSYFKLLFVTL